MRDEASSFRHKTVKGGNLKVASFLFFISSGDYPIEFTSLVRRETFLDAFER